MIESGHITRTLVFKNREKSLILFGIFLIICGAASAISLFRVIITFSSPVLYNSSAQPTNITLVFNLFYFSFTTGWLIWMGVGSIKARRWARTLILFSSWIYLICRGIGGYVSLLYLSHMYFKFGRVSAQFYIVSWLTIIISLIVIGILVLVYGSKNVKATCQFRDSQIRWNDKYPFLIPVAISLFGVFNLGALIGYCKSWDREPKCVSTESQKTTDRSRTDAIVARIDWFQVEHINFPQISLAGPLLVSTKGSHGYSVMAPNKIIRGDEYRGMKVFSSSIVDEEQRIACEGVFGLFVKIVSKKDIVLDMFLNTEVNCRIIMDNFTEGTIRFVETGEILEEPYTFEPGEYHLEASTD